MQGAAQIGVADQDQRSQRFAVHLVAEEQAQFLQHGLGQQVGLVNDHQWRAALAEAQIGEGGANAGDHAGLGEGRLVAEGEQEFAVEAAAAGGGIGKVDDEVAIGVQTGGEGAHGGGLAGANLAGDQAAATFADQVGQAGRQFFLAGGGEQLVGLDGLGEGRTGEAVELPETWRYSLGVAAGSRRANSRRPSSRRCCS